MKSVASAVSSVMLSMSPLWWRRHRLCRFRYPPRWFVQLCRCYLPYLSRSRSRRKSHRPASCPSHPTSTCHRRCQAVIRRVIGAVEVHRQAVALRQVHATADHQLVVTGDEVGRIRRVFCDAVDAHRFGGVVTSVPISVSTTMVCSALSLLPAVSVTVAVTS